MKHKVLYLLILFISITAFTSSNSRIMRMQMENKTFRDGKYTYVKADLYFKLDYGEIITNFYYPENYVFITNEHGESKIYYPEKNEVFLAQNEVLSSEKNILYYFITNQIFDLGIESLGFTVEETNFEDNYQVTIWKPLDDIASRVGKVKLVHENGLPIYTAYFDKEDMIVNKVYFNHYKTIYEFMIPSSITEISYLSDVDSIVSKISYSDIKHGPEANNEMFDFKIPDDAKVVE